MKAVIALILLAGAFESFFLGRLAHRHQFSNQCHAAGFEMNADGMCVYHSRYVHADYITPPANAANYWPAVVEYETKERKARGL